MQQVISELQRLQSRSRFLLLLQRLSVTLAWVLGVIMALVLFDYALRLPGTLRMLLLLGGLGALGWAAWNYLRPAAVFQPSLTQLALRVEQVLPAVSGRLASSVEFAAAGIDQNNPLADRAVRETARRLMGESVGDVVNPSRTRRDVAVMLVVAAVAVTLTVLQPGVASTGLARLFAPYGETRWPARTGVESMMSRIVTPSGVFARGEAMPLRANVVRGPADQRVDAHYRLNADGGWQPWQRIVLTHQGGGVHERLIDTNAEAVEVYFTTDDDETSAEEIELAPPPAVRRASLSVRPPAYAIGHVNAYDTELGQGIDDRSVTDVASLNGSQATLQIELNKPLPTPDAGDVESPRWLRETFGWDEQAELPQFTVDASSPASWTLSWTLQGTRSLPLNLRDEHGLTNAEPIQYRIESVEDRSPSVTITQPAADEAVLPTAVVALKAEGRDDVSLSNIGLEARVQTGAATQEQAMESTPAWTRDQQASSAETAFEAEIELAPLHLKKGDVVLVSGLARDVYEVDGRRHDPARSAVRRLRVMDETDFSTQLRRQLGAVRQNAIRIEAQQAELQDDIRDDGFQPGMSRAQGQIGERIAAQRQSIEEIERLLRQNRLDDAQLQDILRQTNDLLDFAGRSANKAVESIERQDPGANRPGGESANAGAPDAQQGNQANEGARSETAGGERGEQAPKGENQPPRTGDDQPQARPDGAQPQGGNQQQRGNQQPQQSQQGGSQQQGGNQQSQQPQQSGEQQPQGGDQQQQQPQQGAQQGAQQGERQPQTGENARQPRNDQPSADADEREPTPQEQQAIDAQQEVRDELADLIKLLDRDEDTWVVKRQLENISQEQADLEQQTRNLGQQTVGQKADELTDRQRSELDRIAEKQQDLTQQARDLLEQLRDRSQGLEKVDPQAAESMRTAADTGEQQQLDRDMQQAAQQIQQNQMTSAGASQQNAQRTMQKMMEDIEQTKRAQAQQLLRQLASLVESITRLINVQESELNSLALAVDAKNFSGLDRSMIRLNQNTQSVAQEARAAGQEARRVARSLDRAADAQGAAVSALREAPINAANAETAETRSLELLKEAKKLAETVQKETAEQEVQRRREELIEQYKQFAERQIALRNETLELQKAAAAAPLDRRQLVDARRLGSQQEEIRQGLAGLRDTTSEILDSPVFAHVHRLIDGWAARVTDALAGGNVDVDVTDHQQMIADAIGRLMGAVEESMTPPPEFAQDQPNQEQQPGDQQNQQQQQQPLIPPVAQLKLLQGLQEQVYDLTKNLDGRGDLDDAQRRTRLRDLGQQQRDLGDLAQQMLESLQQNQQPGPTPPDAPPEGGEPDRPGTPNAPLEPTEPNA